MLLQELVQVLQFPSFILSYTDRTYRCYHIHSPASQITGQFAVSNLHRPHRAFFQIGILQYLSPHKYHEQALQGVYPK